MFFQPRESSPEAAWHLHTQVPDQAGLNSNLYNNINVNTLKVTSSVGSTVNKVNSFCCYYTNAQSIMNKFSEFSSTVDTLNPSVIGITET